MYGEPTGNRLGATSAGLGPRYTIPRTAHCNGGALAMATQRPRWFNPHPVQRHATD